MKPAISLSTALAIGITLLALGLRLYCLDCWGLWYDEVTGLEVVRGGPEAIFANRFGWLGNQTHANYLVLWVLTLLEDPTQTAMFVRLPSVIAGVVAVPILYLLGRDTLGRPTGLLAATLLALSLPALNYSQDARQYSTTLFLTLVAFYSLMRIRLGGWGKWWAVFAGATAANVLYSYLATTLVLPSLALVASWILWDRWRRREQLGFSWAPPVIAAAVLGIAASYSGPQALAVPSEPLDLSRTSLGDLLHVSFNVVFWLLRMGLPKDIQVQLVTYMLALGLLGLISGWRRDGVSRTVVQFASILMLLPLIEIAIAASTRMVFARYLLFVLPYFLMLVAHGAVALARLISSVPSRSWPKLSPVAVAAIGGLLIGVFAVGSLNYYNPNTFAGENTRPEFKGAASFLISKARPGDVIVVSSKPSHALTVLNFYWKGSPPVSVYDVMDPTLYSLASPRRIFVIVSTWGGLVPDRLLREEGIDLEYTFGSSTAVLTIEGNRRPTLELMQEWLEPFLKSIEEDSWSLTLRGSLYQAQSDTELAAVTYARTKNQGSTLSMWREHVATAEGFEERGDNERAWRELLIAKQNSSGEPEVHRRLAQALASKGLHGFAAQEERIAAELESIAAGAAVGR
jgi:hypothetical protein